MVLKLNLLNKIRDWKNSGFSCLPAPGKALARIFFSITLIIVCLTASSQSYFFFENKISQSNGHAESYFNFLTIMPDGTGSLRTASTNHPIVVQKMQDSSLAQRSTNDLKFLVPVGNPVTFGSENANHIPMRFLFKKTMDSTGSYYFPFQTEFGDKAGKWHKASTVVNQEKTYEELVQQQDFVRIFFNEDDEFYKYLYGERERVNNLAPRKERLFLIVVANTNDPKIGISSSKDFTTVTETFTTLAANLGMRIVTKTIKGGDFSKRNVDQALANLKVQKPAPQDIIVFYYSGHGFRYARDNSPYPRLSLRTNPDQDINKNNLAMEDVYKQILKLKARVNLVLADCCNWDINMPLPQGMDVLRTRNMTINTTSQSLNLANCNALFFSMQPVSIIASSTEKNQLAIGNPSLGGFFTHFFKAMLDQSLYTVNRSDSWLRLLNEAKEKARWQALSAMCGSNRCVQRTKFDVSPPR
ncbi:MAG TPA: caspase family protein [Niabella sp.]|nr:caspase family protein [Niabella sp.]HOZ96017.1 caspase family protein [Niabella sp.]HQW15488.1 caspase family protein [Niabella sp.]HQX20630.1 caspase family protein [Niabella sp.]HQX40506.1 caspase family protein [Niabella sp.]